MSATVDFRHHTSSSTVHNSEVVPLIAPPPWKMYLITLPSAYVLSTVIGMLLSLLHNWPFLVVNFVMNVILVFLLTHVALPLSTRLFHSWLFAQRETGHSLNSMFRKDKKKSQPGAKISEGIDDVRRNVCLEKTVRVQSADPVPIELRHKEKMMATICLPGRAMPEHVVSQEDFLAALRLRYIDLNKLESKLRLASHTTVRQRHFIAPLDSMLVHEGVAKRVERYIREATPLAISAIAQALDNAQLAAHDIGFFIITSCTIPGVVLPGLDVYIVNSMDLPFHVRRLPIAQMGCHAGATSLALAYDYLLGHPASSVLVCNIELSSLNEQPEDTEASSFVSRGLFGDGACAAVIRGDDAANGLRFLATNQYLVPDTIAHMQYRVDEKGNHFDTNSDVVPGLKKGFPAIHTFLATHGYQPCDLEFLVSHTGGPRVMDAVVEGLGVNERLIAASRESLREVGNLSSATVLDVLHRTFLHYRPHDRALGLLLGFGPGSTIEMALGRWQGQ